MFHPLNCIGYPKPKLFMKIIKVLSNFIGLQQLFVLTAYNQMEGSVFRRHNRL